MKKADYESKRLDAQSDIPRLDPHHEAPMLEGHPESPRLAAHHRPEELPAHEEVTPMAAPPDGKIPATSDAQETAGIARGAGWIALGILALMVVAALLWPPKANRQMQYTASTIEYQPVTGAMIAAVPTGNAISDTIVQIMSNVSTDNGKDAVVVYLFNTDSSVIPETATLTNIARRAHDTGKTVVIKAYTDETGRVAYNKRLSEKRAKAVGDYMVSHGVPASHIKAKGYGPTHAYANNTQDRRAEVSLE